MNPMISLIRVRYIQIPLRCLPERINQTFFSAAAVNSAGMVPNNRYNRYNFTFRNTTSFLNDKMKLDVSASYILQNDRNMTNQGQYSNPLVSAYLFLVGMISL